MKFINRRRWEKLNMSSQRLSDAVIIAESFHIPNRDKLTEYF